MSEQDKKHILLIDDDTSLLTTLSDFLSFEGYDVTTADCGEQGLERLKDLTPDLIILDMNMPGMGGLGFLKEISSAAGKPKHPVLVLTARANMAEFFADVDVDGFVPKPCEPNDLLSEVGRIIFLRSGSSTPEEGKGQASPVERLKVLVGEDDGLKRKLLTEALSKAGYIVDSVAHGPEVLEKAIVQRPDVIVLKLILANMNGDAVAGMLNQMPNTKDIPIVLYDDSEAQVPATKFLDAGIGIKKFVRNNKPAEIVEAVNTVVDG